ncbi:VOC family protein, partial [Bacteroides thetaiotaomicron]|uniref:VOC family protein n=1 Tax=Bacteroides thetaiotaomicron TaxID=818 RepID=UPI0034A43D87
SNGYKILSFQTYKAVCLIPQVYRVSPDYLPSEKGVIISFNCEDIDQTLEKVLRKGGKIMMPKTKIEVEGRGWFALFADSEGNRVGLYADK